MADDQRGVSCSKHVLPLTKDQTGSDMQGHDGESDFCSVPYMGGQWKVSPPSRGCNLQVLCLVTFKGLPAS